MKRESIEQQIEQLSEPVALSLNLEVVQVQYRREPSGWTLRIFIDRPEGVRVEDCEAFSRELSFLLDLEDPIPNAYHLEVSSPGLDRPLVKPKDYNRFAGHEITLRTRYPLDGRRNFKGKLVGLQGSLVLLEVEGEQHALEWSAVEKANLIPSPKGKATQLKH